MTSLSLFTGPMALLAAAASASEVFTLGAPEKSATTTTTSSATSPLPSQLPAKTQDMDASAYPLSPPHQQTPSPSSPSTTSTIITARLLSLRSPTAALVYRCHHSAVHAWTLAATAAKPLACAVQHATQHVTRLLLLLGSVLVARAHACCWHLWGCKPATRLRKKLYFELALAVMGPSGNGLLLVVLWPGWLVLGAAVWGVSAVVTRCLQYA